MSACIDLIVGLGNPGREYEKTRHNAGFWFVDALAASANTSFRHDARFHGEVCKASFAGRDVWLLKPATFMNRSGQAVAALARFYKLPVEAILVAHDELDLPPGTARLKRGGGHGGHNGLRDIISHLGTNTFLRLRLGIGHPGTSREVVDYVLTKPAVGDRELVEAAIRDCQSVLPKVVAGEFQRAMNELHASKPPV